MVKNNILAKLDNHAQLVILVLKYILEKNKFLNTLSVEQFAKLEFFAKDCVVKLAKRLYFKYTMSEDKK